ncbi:PilW family protein [Desulfuromonas acetoxidans]|uniref:Methylation n=1 Tax=Desulfuromonas acetoxidans (strain DSM 684 / 11070) TaxID=281689 RepID=Q1JVH5_DESA6|nr:PilW family protein [Desulfuromonas acetoxidans]EAT14238.1 methylation [Desulfuromonas acetoxidans DSM 684]MBF0645808.1 PilW family protein [Desulfuromonas acetoxidans]NVD24804.1 PilW family protein [Desulfuromonas acetoxidans]NVE16849.1 PilW family protein [Desulfuromonas acetoxidans]
MNNRGFTLVEILITLLVSAVVLLGVLNLFNKSQKTYAVQEELAELQQNVRVAKMYLERDARMAGSGILNMSYGGYEVFPIEFENNVDGLSGNAATVANIVTGTDLVVIRYQNFNTDGCGTDPTGTYSACDDLPQLILSNDMPDTATVAIVVDDLETTPYSAWDNGCYCNGVPYTQPTPGMPFIVTAPDGSSSAVLFHTSTLPNSDKIGNAPNYTYNGVTYPNKVLNTYPAGSTINFFYTDGIYEAIYYIENVDGIPCLIRDSGSGGQVIAEYIEDMQLAFGLDTAGDGAVDTWIDNADLTNTQKNQVRLVRLNVVGRTAHEHQNFTGNRPAVEDHGAGPADGFRRRQLTVTVKVRNLAL